MSDFITINDTDPIVYRVARKIKERSEAGMKKYGVTMMRQDVTTLQWINHAQEEAMDFIIYLERLKHDYEEMLKMSQGKRVE
jgi:hypothetical protein